jgi:eukaryotic-like serine/threonine-protein kinase
MSRDRSRSRLEAAPAEQATITSPLGGALVGYRLLRRIASGERADVYLAAAESPDPGEPRDAGALAPPADVVTSVADPAAVQRPLVAVRVYPPHVSSDSVALEIEAMSTDATGTLPALYDVAALDDGRCCLAVERLGGLAVSRLLTERTLSAGEAVTILAPVVVAVADLAARGLVHTRLAATDILLDDAGRPRIIGLGALRRLPGHAHAAERIALLRTGHVAVAELLEDVAAAVRPAGVFDDAVDLIRGRLDARPFQPCETELERRLFAAAVPEPIAGVDVRLRAARLPARMSAPAPIAPVRHDDEGLENGGRPATRRPHWIRALLGLAQLPDDLGERVASAVDAVPGAGTRSRLGSAIRARSRTLTVGGLIGGGALVLMLTLVPPATAGDVLPGRVNDPDAAARESATGQVVSESADDEPGHAEAVEAVENPGIAGDDAAAAARSLLELRTACFATLDLECLDTVVQPGSAIESADRAKMLAAREGDAPPDDGFDLATVQVTAEMGDAVLIGVTRATPEREPASLLVVRGEAGWRLREIFD